MKNRRSPKMINIQEADVLNLEHGKKFGGKRRRLAASTGGQQIGCSWYELAPGRQSFPHHYHFGNEESFYILSGTGEFRLGKDRFTVTTGDYISCPPGEDSSHSITNTGTAPLTYLAISTAHSTDVVVYPDSGKFSAVGGADMHKGLKSAPFGRLVKDQPSVDYYLDEE